MERNYKKEFIINVLYTVIILLFALTVYYVTVKFLLTFVIGVIIALSVQQPSVYLSKKIKLSQGIWSVIISLFLYLIIVTFGCFFVYKILILGLDLTDYIPELLDYLRKIFENTGERYSALFERFPKEIRDLSSKFFEEAAQKFALSIGNGITVAISTVIRKIPSFFISGIVTLVASCYISKDFTRLKNFLKSLLGSKTFKKTAKIKSILIESVFKILKSYLILASITAFELYIGFMLLGIKKPFLCAILIAVVDLLPVLGTGTVLIPWAVIEILLNNLSFGIALGIIYLIVTLVRNFSEPKIIGTQIGINSLFTLAAMFLGLKALGFWGLILFPVILIVTVQYYKDEMKEELSA